MMLKNIPLPSYVPRTPHPFQGCLLQSLSSFCFLVVACSITAAPTQPHSDWCIHLAIPASGRGAPLWKPQRPLQGFSLSAPLPLWALGFCIVGAVLRRMLSKTPGFHPLDASSVAPMLCCDNQKFLQTLLSVRCRDPITPG